MGSPAGYITIVYFFSYGLIQSKLHVNKNNFLYNTRSAMWNTADVSNSWAPKDGLDLGPQLIYTLSWESQRQEI